MRRFLIPALTATTALASGAALAQSGEMASFCDAAIVPVDANADDRVSADEMTAMRDVEFEALDANKDGSIDRTEWETCMERQQAAMGDGPSGTWSPEDFADYDPEVEGDLTAEDFAQMATEAWESGDAEAQARFASPEEMARGAESGASEAETFARAAVGRFRGADSDGDGTLTAEEFQSAEGGSDKTGEAYQARFDTLDADDTGTVTPQEYRAAGTWAADPNGLVEGAEQTASDSSAESGMDEAGMDELAEGAEGDASGSIPVIEYFVVYY